MAADNYVVLEHEHFHKQQVAYKKKQKPFKVSKRRRAIENYVSLYKEKAPKSDLIHEDLRQGALLNPEGSERQAIHRDVKGELLMKPQAEHRPSVKEMVEEKMTHLRGMTKSYAPNAQEQQQLLNKQLQQENLANIGQMPKFGMERR